MSRRWKIRWVQIVPELTSSTVTEADVFDGFFAKTILQALEKFGFFHHEGVMDGGLGKADGKDGAFDTIGRGVLGDEGSNDVLPRGCHFFGPEAVIELPRFENLWKKVVGSESRKVLQRRTFGVAPLIDEAVAQALFAGGVAHGCGTG